MNEQKQPEKRFRSSFGGGYQKNDVNAYIETMTAQFQSIEETLKNTINHQKEQIDALRDAAQQAKETESTAALLQSERDTRRAEAEALRVRLEAIETEKTQLQETIDTLTASAADAERRCEQAVERCSVLELHQTALQTALNAAKEETARLQAEAAQKQESMPEVAVPMSVETQIQYPEDYEVLRHKAEEYDRMSAQIGAMLLKANANAEEIVRVAKAEAEEMLKTVNAELAAARGKAQNMADSVIGTLDSSMRHTCDNCREDVLGELEDIRSAVNTLFLAVEGKYRDINQKLDYARTEMENNAKTAIYQAAAPRVWKNAEEQEHMK